MKCERMMRDSPPVSSVILWWLYVRSFVCFLTLDFVTVKYFPVVYVVSRHFAILFLFLYANHCCYSDRRK